MDDSRFHSDSLQCLSLLEAMSCLVGHPPEVFSGQLEMLAEAVKHLPIISARCLKQRLETTLGAFPDYWTRHASILKHKLSLNPQKRKEAAEMLALYAARIEAALIADPAMRVWAERWLSGVLRLGAYIGSEGSSAWRIYREVLSVDTSEGRLSLQAAAASASALYVLAHPPDQQSRAEWEVLHLATSRDALLPGSLYATATDWAPRMPHLRQDMRQDVFNTLVTQLLVRWRQSVSYGDLVAALVSSLGILHGLSTPLAEYSEKVLSGLITQLTQGLQCKHLPATIQQIADLLGVYLRGTWVPSVGLEARLRACYWNARGRTEDALAEVDKAYNRKPYAPRAKSGSLAAVE